MDNICETEIHLCRFDRDYFYNTAKVLNVLKKALLSFSLHLIDKCIGAILRNHHTVGYMGCVGGNRDFDKF